jgi:arylformamidase
MNVHTAAHLDAPFHFYPEGKTIEQIPVERFQGEAIPINLFGISPDSPITVQHLEPYADKIQAGSIVLLCTGWGKKRGYTKEYYNQWPYLSGEGAQWLVDRGVKGIGIDGLSIGGWGMEKAVPPHEILLANEVWPLEELHLTEELLEEEKWFVCAFPIKLKGFSGAPVRAVAIAFE